jgi:oxygen-independent coproporphyrinogen-3 oxidase
LKHHFNLAEDAEITIEAAPGTLPREKASLLHKLGVNRISYGIQTLNDKLLSKMNRDYSVKEAIQELEDTIQIIGNINVDTMYGFDGEPDSALTDTLTTFMDIGIPCLSIYALDTQRCVQEKEYFGPAVDELYKKKIELFQRSRELLMKRGFVNLLQNIFLKPGEASYIHQVRRWENLPLVALGISSMGYGPRKPYQNCATLKPYYRHLDEGRPPIVSMEVLSPEMEMAREVSSQLRFTQVNILDILKKYGVDLDLGFHELIDALINLGYLDRVDYKIKLSSEATYYNNVIPMLFSPDSFKEKLMGLPGEYVENFPIPHVLTRLGRTQSASIRVRPYTADS